MLCSAAKSNGLCDKPVKLDLDFSGGTHLTAGMCGDEEQRSDVVGRLFYLITAAAEDAAALAAGAQSRRIPDAERQNAVAKLRSSGEMIEIVASAIGLIERR